MTEMAPEVEAIDLTDFSEAVEWGCDYSQYEMSGHHTHAQWIAFVAPCPACGANGGSARLICEPCKNTILYATWAAMECTNCDFVCAPAKLAFKGFEPINRRAA